MINKNYFTEILLIDIIKGRIEVIMKLALIQMDVLHGQVKANQDKVFKLMTEAMTAQPDVLVLPEMWNTGYDLENLSHLADPEGQQIQAFLSQFAREHAVNILGGSVATIHPDGFYNSSYAISREGKVLSTYNKVHLFGLMNEDNYLQAGSELSHFSFDGVDSSAVICYDIRFPEWVRTLMSQGSKILFVPAQWPEQRLQQWEILLRARAIENQAFVISVNRVGQGPNDTFAGDSLVIDPLGNVLLQAPNQERVFTVVIDEKMVDDIRGVKSVFEDRRPDLYD